VRGADGEVQAAISVSVPRVRWEQQPAEHWAELALGAAAQLAEQIGYAPAAASEG
jgi:DNA-binding IclR family transcriptional regulator